jgi:hypothetical protein
LAPSGLSRPGTADDAATPVAMVVRATSEHSRSTCCWVSSKRRPRLMSVASRMMNGSVGDAVDQHFPPIRKRDDDVFHQAPPATLPAVGVSY